MYLVQSFFEAVSDITDVPLKIALTDLSRLFACYGIVENPTVFLQVRSILLEKKTVTAKHDVLKIC